MGKRCFLCEPEKRLVLFKDDEIVAMLNKYPARRGHLIIFVPGMDGHDPDLEYRYDERCISEICFIRERLGIESYSILKLGGPDSGQMADHFHWHLIPRKRDDEPLLISRPQEGRVEITPEEIVEMRERWKKSRLNFSF